MTDELISRLSADLAPVPPRTMERRLLLALAVGIAVTMLLVVLLLDLALDRPFGAAWGGPMFWIKGAYALCFGLLGLAAAPALARPDGRIIWPLAGAAILMVFALGFGSMLWMEAGFDMPILMGATALVCPWLILATSLPILATLLATLRATAPRSPTMAGLAAGLCAGGLGAAIYAMYCGETGMMFMAVWYSLGIAMVAGLGAVLGRFLLRW